MTQKKKTTKKKRRRKRPSKAEHFFGAVIIEGLGIIAIIAMVFAARKATEPDIPIMAESNHSQVTAFGSDAELTRRFEVPLNWQQPNSNRFDERLQQASY